MAPKPSVTFGVYADHKTKRLFFATEVKPRLDGGEHLVELECLSGDSSDKKVLVPLSEFAGGVTRRGLIHVKRFELLHPSVHSQKFQTGKDVYLHVRGNSTQAFKVSSFSLKSSGVKPEVEVVLKSRENSKTLSLKEYLSPLVMC